MSASSTASSDEAAQSRLSINEVPDQISRIFFGDPKPSYNPPSSYGAPSSSYGAPAYGAPAAAANYYPPYPNYYSDLFLLIKLGQAALIIFIILAIVGILFMLILGCLYCIGSSSSGGKRQGRQPVQSSYGPYDTSYGNGGFDSSIYPEKPPVIRRQGLPDDDDDVTLPPRPLVRQPGRDHLNRSSDSSSFSSFEPPPPAAPPKVKKQSHLFDGSDRSKRTPTSPDLDIRGSTTTDDTVVQSSPPKTPKTPKDGRRPKTPRPFSSQQSDSTDDRSQPRSVPYYEVPSPHTAFTAREVREQQRQQQQKPQLPQHPPPPLSRLSAADLNNPRSRLPYSYVDREEQTTIRSRLV